MILSALGAAFIFADLIIFPFGRIFDAIPDIIGYLIILRWYSAAPEVCRDRRLLRTLYSGAAFSILVSAALLAVPAGHGGFYTAAYAVLFYADCALTLLVGHRLTLCFVRLELLCGIDLQTAFLKRAFLLAALAHASAFPLAVFGLHFVAIAADLVPGAYFAFVLFTSAKIYRRAERLQSELAAAEGNEQANKKGPRGDL